MGKAVTAAQLRKIYALARERGMDDELLHSHMEMLLGKDSLKELTVAEGISLIDSLEGRGAAHKGSEKATYKQMNYIFGLMKKMGWSKENGEPDTDRLDMFLRSPRTGFNIGSYKWLTRKQASDLIEAFKRMQGQKKVSGS